LFFRAVSIVVLQAFLLTSVSYPGITQPKFDDPAVDSRKPAAIDTAALAQDPSKIMISEACGIIKDQFAGNSGTVIVHIQEAHCNFEAQNNICAMLECMINNCGLKFISLEGADGYIDTNWFKAFPDKDIRKEAADYFVKKGQLTAAEYLSITSDYPIILYGAETREYYISNYNAFIKTFGVKDQIQDYIRQVRDILKKLKQYIYTAKLKAFDGKVGDYKDKTIGFTDFSMYLMSQCKEYGIDISKYKNFSLLADTVKEGEGIDFKKVNEERGQAIEALNSKLSKDALSEFVVKSLAFKENKISPVTYYRYLESAARSSGLDISTYKNFSRYINYVNTHSQIRPEILFEELGEVETAIREKLYKNQEERDLDRLCKSADILYGLTEIQLSNTDFSYFKSRRKDFDSDPFIGFVNAEISKYGLSYKMNASYDIVQSNMKNLEDFYHVAIKRDQALVDNTLQGMKENNVNIAVLITGGFHTSGMTKLFKDKGISYLVVAPVITQDVESPYIQVLTNQITPLTGLVEPPKNKKDGMLAPAIISSTLANDPTLNGFKDITRAMVKEEVEREWADINVSGAYEKLGGKKGGLTVEQFSAIYMKLLEDRMSQLVWRNDENRKAVLAAAQSVIDKMTGVKAVAVAKAPAEGAMREDEKSKGEDKPAADTVIAEPYKLDIVNAALGFLGNQEEIQRQLTERGVVFARGPPQENVANTVFISEDKDAARRIARQIQTLLNIRHWNAGIDVSRASSYSKFLKTATAEQRVQIQTIIAEHNMGAELNAMLPMEVVERLRYMTDNNALSLDDLTGEVAVDIYREASHKVVFQVNFRRKDRSVVTVIWDGAYKKAKYAGAITEKELGDLQLLQIGLQSGLFRCIPRMGWVFSNGEDYMEEFIPGPTAYELMFPERSARPLIT